MLCFVILTTCWLSEKKQLSAESDKPWSWHKGTPQQGEEKGRTGITNR